MKLHLNNRRGFTLIEIVIVVGLTVVVMGLVFGPLIQSFNLTQRAEVMVRAQDNARIALSQVSRDLSNAMYVYDNTRPDTVIQFPVTDAAGGRVALYALYGKVDMVLPRMRAYCTSDAHPDGVSREYPRHYINPNTDKMLDEAAPLCPVDGSPLELRPVQPLTPDTVIVRYFVGLENPTALYSNGYEQKLAMAGGDNMYILYRVEFNPSDTNLFPTDDPSVNINDPDFFYRDGFTEEWMKICRPVVTLGQTDLARVEYDDDGNPVSVTPSVRFMPSAIKNDPLVPTTEAGDDPEHGDTPPTVYKASYGHWVLPYNITLEGRRNGNPVRYWTDTFLTPEGYTHMGIKDDSGAVVFDITRYEDTARTSQFGVGTIQPQLPDMAFTVNTVRGTANFAFPVLNPAESATYNEATSKIADSSVINDSLSTEPFRHLLINEPGDPNRPLDMCTVVPSSVKVVGPDAAGPAIGRPVLYTRLPFLLYEPGSNEYTVDPYYDEANGVAAIRFYTQHTLSGTEWGPPLPPGNVFVYYEVQNNRKDDTLRADYWTKSLMTVVMGIRVYASSTGRAEVVELTNRIRLKNIRT